MGASGASSVGLKLTQGSQSQSATSIGHVSWSVWHGNAHSDGQVSILQQVRDDTLARIRASKAAYIPDRALDIGATSKHGVGLGGHRGRRPMGIAEQLLPTWDDRFRHRHPSTDRKKILARSLSNSENVGKASLMDRMLWRVSEMAVQNNCRTGDVWARLMKDFDLGLAVSGNKRHAVVADSQLSRLEFNMMCRRGLLLDAHMHEIEQLFVEFDVDTDGRISMAELVQDPRSRHVAQDAEAEVAAKRGQQDSWTATGMDAELAAQVRERKTRERAAQAEADTTVELGLMTMAALIEKVPAATELRDALHALDQADEAHEGKATGVVTAEQLREHLLACGVDEVAPVSDAGERAFEAVRFILDADGTGDSGCGALIRYAELVKLYLHYKAQNVVMRLDACIRAKGSLISIVHLFSSVDVNHNGRLSMPELRQELLAKKLGLPLPDEEWADLRSVFDPNGDGTVDYAEFDKVLLRFKRADHALRQRVLESCRRRVARERGAETAARPGKQLDSEEAPLPLLERVMEAVETAAAAAGTSARLILLELFHRFDISLQQKLRARSRSQQTSRSRSSGGGGGGGGGGLASASSSRPTTASSAYGDRSVLPQRVTDGQLSRLEFINLLRDGLGLAAAHHEVDQVFSTFDVDESRRLTAGELLDHPLVAEVSSAGPAPS